MLHLACLVFLEQVGQLGVPLSLFIPPHLKEDVPFSDRALPDQCVRCRAFLFVSSRPHAPRSPPVEVYHKFTLCSNALSDPGFIPGGKNESSDYREENLKFKI